MQASLSKRDTKTYMPKTKQTNPHFLYKYIWMYVPMYESHLFCKKGSPRRTPGFDEATKSKLKYENVHKGWPGQGCVCVCVWRLPDFWRWLYYFALLCNIYRRVRACQADSWDHSPTQRNMQLNLKILVHYGSICISVGRPCKALPVFSKKNTWYSLRVES